MFIKKNKLISFFLNKFTIKEVYFKISIFILVLFYFLNSLLYSRNIYDSHLFWLFDESMRFLNGETFYKDIAVIYGVGQPLINSLSLLIFGKNVFSIFLITNIFFFLAIFFISLIGLKLKLDKIDTLFLILVIINILPTPLIAWSIYLAYFPLILSLYLILEDKKIDLFFSGFFLAIAVLIRETILLSAIIILFFIIIENFSKNKKFNNLQFFILGFLFPLITFFIYMFLTSNYIIHNELTYALNSWQTLINLGYYIENDISFLRKFYIFFLVPFRELFLVLLQSIQNFWFNWLMIYMSYFFCMIFFLVRVFKNNYWKENELIKYKITIVSVYCLSLIIQNLHQVSIVRVATGSVIGIIILYYFFSKIILNTIIKLITYVLIFVLFYIFSLGISNEFDGIEGRLKKFYRISYSNFENNIDFLLSKRQKNISEEKPYVAEFRNMNYDISIHKFYNNIIEICNELRIKKGIKYSDNQTGLWELNYFCKTTPKNYYIATNSEILEENFKKSQLSKKYNSNNSNTIEFYVSDDLDLKETIYWDKRGSQKKRKIKDFKILYFADLENDYPFLFRNQKKRYFFITQSYKKV